MKKKHAIAALAAIAGTALALAGCSGDIDELRQWTEQQRKEAKPSVTPLLPPKKFLPQPYESAAGVDPFSTQKLTVAIRQEAAQPNSLLTAEIKRRKEPLESFPLDSMTMVGSLLKQGQPVALIKVDNLLYQVRPGNYLGQNYGKIVKVGETEVVLRELVQDASGEWVERTATLQLQEKSK